MSNPISDETYLEQLALYDALVARFPDIKRKGKKNPYTSVNGHMFSFLGKDGVLCLRLSKTDRETFLAEHKTKISVSYGATMKEYVDIPADLLADTEQLIPYFESSYAYVSGLKPKPTKKK